MTADLTAILTAIRNIAIIAHVDHGKTSLVDQLLIQSGTMKHMEDATLIMDSNDQEKERWITIYAKNTSIRREWTVINIIDTPWHADFSSEVERVLRMVDTVLLVVDAYEGPMPQTKFVLKKSLELGIRPLVVINKIDKPTARPDRVVDQLFDLFFALGATNEQADFKVIYTSARDWFACMETDQVEEAAKNPTMKPLFDFILKNVTPAEDKSDMLFRMQVTNLAYDDYVGRLWVWRIREGTVKVWDNVVVFNNEGQKRKAKISKLYTTLGVQKQEVQQWVCGDIVIIAWIGDIYVWETIGAEWIEPYPALQIDEPTLRMDFCVNDSPFAWREWKYVTSRNIMERLEKEMETNVWLRIEPQAWWNRCTVSWRWELHLSVLIETMRREWFELQVSAPQVIMKKDGGKTQEPIEQVVVTVEESFAWTVIEMLAQRKWMMQDMQTENGMTTLIFDVPTRGLLGFRADFFLETKWEWILYSSFSHYDDYKWDIQKRVNWSLISGFAWKSMRYSIWKLQDRWTIFVEPATELYEWMIVWESAKPGDMSVNLTKNKQQSNMRTSWNDENMLLQPIKKLTLEDALSYIGQDEYVEVTPESIRIRKIHLKETDRKSAGKRG